MDAITEFVSPEAEEAVIGGLLINAKAVEITSTFLKPTDFWTLRYQYIYESILRLQVDEKQIDFVSVIADLKDRGKLDEIGGRQAILLIQNNAQNSTGHSIETYAQLVYRLNQRRIALANNDKMRGLLMNPNIDTITAISNANELWGDVMSKRVNQRVATAEEGVDELLAMFQRAMDNKGNNLLGVTTGFRDLNKFTMGYQQQEVYIIAGRPAMGKTSLMLTQAVLMALSGHTVLYHSTEMSLESIMIRCLSILLAVGHNSFQPINISGNRLRMARFTSDEKVAVTRALDVLSELPIIIDDSPDLKPSDIKANIIRYQRSHNIQCVFADHLAEMDSDKPHNTKHDKYTDMINDIKRIARNHHIPMVIGHQLSRGVEQRQNKRPLQSDLRESGTIEQVATMVMMLYRDVVYNENTEHPNIAEVIVVKNRNGDIGTAILGFDAHTTRFHDVEHIKLTLE